jgi:hypothetical protein
VAIQGGLVEITANPSTGSVFDYGGHSVKPGAFTIANPGQHKGVTSSSTRIRRMGDL